MAELLSVQDLPVGFRYPASFVRVIELGLTNLEPWHMLEGSRLRERNQGLAQRFPARSLVPFAIRQDNDDVACWDLEQSHALQHALAGLAPNERWVLALAYYRDHSHSEIAAITQMPLGTVKSLINRAQQKLRDILLPPPATPIR